MIRVGDKVIVRDCGKEFSKYSSFMDKHKTKDTKPWCPDIENGLVGVVESINPHLSNIHLKLAIVNTEYWSFIIGLDGLEKTFEEGDRVRCLSNCLNYIERDEVVTVRSVLDDKFKCEDLPGIYYNIDIFELVKDDISNNESMKSNLDVKGVVKEVKYYLDTNLGKFDITETINNFIKNQ